MGLTSVQERVVSRSADLKNAAPILIPAVAAFVMKIWNVGRPSMYGTEAVTKWAASLPLPSLFHVLTHVDAVHGTYYFLMHFVLIAGGGTFMLRLPSVIAMTVAAALTARLTRRMTGSDSAALLAGLALVIAPLTTEYGQAGRSYAIDTAAAVITWTLFLTAVQDPANPTRAWRYYTVAIALTAYLHEMTLLVLGANFATLLWARAPRETWRRWLIATAWALVLSIPLLVASVVQSRQVNWIKPASWATVKSVYQNFLGPGTTAVWLNAALLGVCVLVAIATERASRGVTLVRLALPILFVSPMLLLIESRYATPLYGGIRYVVWCLPALAMLDGTGLDQIFAAIFRGRAKIVGVLAGIGVLVASLSSQWSLQKLIHSAAGSPQDLAAAATYLHDNERAVVLRAAAGLSERPQAVERLGAEPVRPLRGPPLRHLEGRHRDHRGHRRLSPRVARRHQRAWAVAAGAQGARAALPAGQPASRGGVDDQPLPADRQLAATSRSARSRRKWSRAAA